MNDLSDIHAVVTGGAGFIGSHLVDQLLSQNATVTVLDNFCNGRRENLRQHEGNSNLQIVDVDITDGPAIDPHFGSADWVFHLAALADIVPSIQNPAAYFRANVDGTFAVLEACRSHGVKRILYAASSSCYGIPDVYPTPETAPIAPEYPYALTKYLGEQLALHWAQVYELPIVSLRLFNVYGPRTRTSGTYGAVFGVFLAQKLAGKPFTVVGDGTQTRDFTYVTDVAAAFITAAGSDRCNAVYNVGSGGCYSVNQLVENLGGDVEYVPKRPGEPDSTFADIGKIRNELNWSPSVEFADGVQRMVDQIEYWRDAPVWDADSIKNATRDWFRYLGKKQTENNE